MAEAETCRLLACGGNTHSSLFEHSEAGWDEFGPKSNYFWRAPPPGRALQADDSHRRRHALYLGGRTEKATAALRDRRGDRKGTKWIEATRPGRGMWARRHYEMKAAPLRRTCLPRGRPARSSPAVALVRGAPSPSPRPCASIRHTGSARTFYGAANTNIERRT